ncbi:MoaD/ThiS family protein [Rhodoferax sp. 4810]|uniref:MoaD/ThiS family protein n=1 Tax=Thiospirillum jenense TaxID=1653858 RepID=A0A839H3P0_9GAMM|nr:MoaD/ThiS family protein [Thiospirillum jenense]MBB1076282.1 MoaD/ThiS family protein [Rhodoferax jenense]MBB1124875.1 MoaD/ThiS family protein [Thiospirillum jenense]
MSLNNQAKFYLRYFASLREQVQCSDEVLGGADVDMLETVAALRAHLAGRGGCWATAFAPEHVLLVAVNHALGSSTTRLADGDEVAFFPPVTGG